MYNKMKMSEIKSIMNSWIDLNTESMNEVDRFKYNSRKIAIKMYVDGVKFKTILEVTGVSRSETIRYLNRCMECDTLGNYIGYSALLPYKRTTSVKTKLEKLFTEYPGLENFLIGNYYGDKEYTLEKNMNIRTLHSRFLIECLNRNVPDYEFPFNLKDKGYAALTRYIKGLSLDNQKLQITRESKEIEKKFNSIGIGESNGIKPVYPFNIVQLDGHKIDMLYSVETENKQGELIKMPATRAWLITVIDVATRMIIGYAITPNENYNQYDVLQAIYNSIVPHRKIIFTRKSLRYPDEIGFHSICIPETKWASFDTIMMDNAKAHLAKNVQNKLTGILKCSINFGAVASPESRGIVERVFNTIETGGFHRLPGTTGSNIKDNKRNNPEYESVKYNITYTDICELVEFFIAEYNTSAHSALENQTPLQVMKRRISAGMLPYIIPEDTKYEIERLTHFIEEKTIRGGYSTGQKPHINYLGAKYHSVNIVIPMDYVNKKAIIEVNPNDVSHVKLYSLDGVFIADLVADGEWGRRPHSIKTREAALKRKNKNLESNTIFTPHLTEYERELKENAKSSRRSRTKIATIKREKEENTIKYPEKETLHTDNKGDESNQTLTKEEIELLKSMSIEDAYWGMKLYEK